MIKKKKIKEKETIKKRKKVEGFGIWKGGKPFVRDEKFLEGKLSLFN